MDFEEENEPDKRHLDTRNESYFKIPSDRDLGQSNLGAISKTRVTIACGQKESMNQENEECQRNLSTEETEELDESLNTIYNTTKEQRALLLHVEDTPEAKKDKQNKITNTL